MGIEEYFNAIDRDQFVPEEEWQWIEEIICEMKEIIGKISSIPELPTFYEAGSKKKGTMIRDLYDVDLVIIYPNRTNMSIERISFILKDELTKIYYNVQLKNIALSILFPNKKYPNKQNFHIDLVPARELSNNSQLAWIYTWDLRKVIKSSVQLHIEATRSFQRLDIIRLIKLWRIRNYCEYPGFILERISIEITQKFENYLEMSQKKILIKIFMYIRDELEDLHFLKDPADPSQNLLQNKYISRSDLHSLINLARKTLFQNLNTIEGWRNVYTGNL